MRNRKICSWFLFGFFALFLFAPGNATAEPIDDIVTQMQEIYGYMDDSNKDDIDAARAELQDFVVNATEAEWDTVLGVGTADNLLTEQVISRFDGNAEAARTAAQDILAGLGEIYYSTDATELRTTLEAYKTEYIDEFRLLFGDDFTLAEFYQLFVDAREALPGVIDQTEAGLLANAPNADLIEDMPAYLNDAMEQALLSNTAFSGKLAAIDWSTAKLIAQQEVLAGYIDPNGDARLSLALAVIRSETELAAGATALQVGDEPEYTVNIMGRNATSLLAWASSAPSIVAVSNDTQTGNFVLEAVGPGSALLTVYRDYEGGTAADDWLLTFEVTVTAATDITVKGYASWYKIADNAGITVTAKQGETTIAATETDVDGLFELALGDGTYDIELTVVGYLKTIIQAVTVADGALVEVSTAAEPIKMRAGDINASDLVDLSDLGLLAASYGAESEQADYLLAADFDRSGLVDLSDLGHLAQHYGNEVRTIIYE